MIMIGIGANLSSSIGTPVETCRAALAAMSKHGITVIDQSPWYESAPVPASDQPWFVNGIVSINTTSIPQDLLTTMLEIERQFGRERGEANAARTIDLDLIAYDQEVISAPGLELPHPRIAERTFVLLPLRDISPEWIHPVTGLSIDAMINAIEPIENIRPLT